MSRTYNIVVVAVTLSALCVLSLVNVVVDPGAIYLNKWLTNSEFDLYASTLLRSEHGMVADGWNERATKMALARTAGRFECAVLGSSHVMFVSSHRRPSVAAAYCGSLVNLGVSGGGFEDLVIFIYTMAIEHQLPAHLFIGIDPWTLNFDTDARWSAREDVYKKGLEAFESDDPVLRESYWTKIVANLVNLDYFNKSIALMRKKGAGSIFREHLARIRTDKRLEAERLRPIVVKAFDYSRGSDASVNLPDGSYVYDKAYLDDRRQKLSLIIDEGYKITKGLSFDPNAVRLLTTMTTYLKDVGVEVHFVLTPYHHKVWNDKNSATVPVMKVVSGEVRRLGREQGIAVVGSYDPVEIGCTESEFYDFMHPQPSCLSKVFARRAGTVGIVPVMR